MGQVYDSALAIIHKQQAVGFHLRFLKWLGRPIPPGARVLDFGCGAGHSVDVLLERGFDAYGCDVQEWWGKDVSQLVADYGVTYVPPPHVASRLRCFNSSDPNLPFEKNSFDLCYSDQVLEHVFDHVSAFRQIAGVLKPDGISVHRFPGPNMLMEGHVDLPFSALCHLKPYLMAWALLGRRSPTQRGQSWREALYSNIRVMQTVKYRSKRYLRACAQEANVKIDFLEADEMLLREFGTAAKLVAQVRRFAVDRPLARLLSLMSQRYMVLTHS